MKKYVKPDLYFESFQLNQHIAACGYDLNSGDVKNCVSSGDNHGVYPNYSPLTYFSSENGACVDGAPEIYCYFNGTITDEQFKVLTS